MFLEMGDLIHEMTTKFAKLEKFEVVDFRRWKKKMHFMLTTLKAAYVLTTLRPAEPEAGVVKTIEEIRRIQKWTMMTTSAKVTF